MLADERKDFQPVDQLFAVLVRFFALAVCSEQQILELVSYLWQNLGLWHSFGGAGWLVVHI